MIMEHIKKIKTIVKCIKYLFLIISLLSVMSCETSVDASDLLDKQDLVVINGYLSPQSSLLQVQVSRSKSRASSSSSDISDLVITNATVTIANTSGEEIGLVYTETTFNYEAQAMDLPIISGEEYFLTVVVDGITYSASCTIPQETVQNIEVEVRDNNDPDVFGNKELRLNIEDIRDTRNFYIVSAEVPGSGIVDFEFEQFTTDSNRENAVISVDGVFTLFDSPDPNQALIKVANAEEILYDALRATFLNDYNEDNPFFEPVIAPSNIKGENGFGVFAGFQLTEVETNF